MKTFFLAALQKNFDELHGLQWIVCGTTDNRDKALNFTFLALVVLV